MKRLLLVRIVSFVILGLLSILGVILILKATPEGMGLTDDSIGYIAGARSMLAGQGYREAWLASNGPVTHFPPGFPFTLVLTGWFGLDPLRGARLVNSLLFGLNTALIGILGWRMTRFLPAGLILAALFVTSASLLQITAVAMSEPLFIFLSLLAFWMFDLYFERDAHWLWLVLCGASVGAAYLTRYAGLALVATFLVGLLVLHDGWRKRLISLAIFLAGVLPWMLGWAIRDELVAGNVTNRALVWHPITASNFDTALYNVSLLLMPVETWRRTLIKIPGFFESFTALILGAILVWILVRGWNRFWKPPSAARPEVLSFTNGLYIFSYLASILASMSFFDASTKFKLRILAPAFVSLLILLVAGGLWLWKKWPVLAGVLAVFLVGSFAYNQVQAVQELSRGGQGFASFRWYDSKAMVYLRGLPRNTIIYTNQPGAVYLYTGRGTYVLPDTYDPVTAEPRPGYQHGLAVLHQQVNAGQAVLALFEVGDMSASDRANLSGGLNLAFKAGGDEIFGAGP